MIRFGILGAGNIAHRFAASLEHEPRAKLMAASCRTLQKAQAFLRSVPHAQGAHAYGSFAELLTDPEVDAIYLALPHEWHFEWAAKALQARKAVLCEKPAMLSASQMVEISDIVHDRNTLFMEAMKPRFTPLYEKVKEAVQTIGPVTKVEATLCNDMLGLVEGTGTYHMTPGPGSGALLDCGTYCASWIEDFCPGKLRIVSVGGKFKHGIDIYAAAQLDCDGVEAVLECAFDRAKPRRATIVGERGRVVVDELHRPTQAILVSDDGTKKGIEAPFDVDDFFGEISHFVDLYENGDIESPIMPLNASVRDAVILDAVRDGMNL